MPRTAAQFVAHLDTLASLPAITQRVLAHLGDRKSNAASVASLIDEDPPLAAKVMRVANSGLLARGDKVGDIRRAVSRIGFREVGDLVTIAAMAALVGDRGGILTDLYIQSVVGSLLSHVIVGQARRVPKAWRKDDPCRLAALVHDIGSFSLIRHVPEVAQKVLGVARARNQPLAEIERDLIGYDHQEIGALLLTRWRLPDAVVEAARYHHRPSEAPESHRQVVAVVHVVDLLVARHGLGPNAAAPLPFADLRAISDLGLSNYEVARIGDSMREINERAEALALIMSE